IPQRSGWAHWPVTRPSLTLTMLTWSQVMRRPGRDAEEVVGVYRLDPQPDGHAVCGLGDVLLPEGHVRPGRDHISVVVGEGYRIPGRPVRYARANRGLATHADPPSRALLIVGRDAALPLPKDLDRAARLLVSRHMPLSS